MRNVKKPYTVMVFRNGARTETLARPGHLPPRSQNGASVEGILQPRGMTGKVTIRHHEGSMFGKPGRLVAVSAHTIK